VRVTAKEFAESPSKRLSLLGMSGVGKSALALKLPKDRWFHYSADYRIGTRYLEEEINDLLIEEASKLDSLKALLQSDSIYIQSNLTIENLEPLAAYLGKLGNPELGGLALPEFKRRLQRHHDSEVAALNDVPHFIKRSERLYGYPHFLNDAGGSLCELGSPETITTLAECTVILYLEASPEDEELLIKRAQKHPKPLYYRPEFLDQQINLYMQFKGLRYIAEIVPNDFVKWVFPQLFRARLPRYKALAEEYGYIVDAREVLQVRDEQDFLDLVAQAIDKQNT